MKINLLMLLIMSLLINTAFAGVNDCPDVERIKAVNLNNVAVDTTNSWTASFRPYHLYATREKWTFIIGNVGKTNKAKDPNDAMLKASAALLSLHYKEGPIFTSIFKICHYSTDVIGIEAAAFTPPLYPE